MGNLTKAIILQGIDYREDVYLPTYDCTVTVRPLTDLELYECRRKSGIMDIISKMGIMGKNAEKEILDMITNDPNVSKEWMLAYSRLMIEVAKCGVVDAELREMVDNPLKGQVGQPDTVMAIELLRGGALDIIGARILEITTGSVANFSIQKTEKSS